MDSAILLPLLRAQARRFGGLEAFDAEAELARCASSGARLLAAGDGDYPDLLASIPDAPPVLYLRGALRPGPGSAIPPSVAIVGSRRPTPYGRRAARRLASEAARAGLAVVSGLARGIDTEAHQAALEAGGATWAVLGSGLDRLYPPENRGLAGRIVAAGGAVLSEVPLAGPPLAPNFPRRNRIISGLSWMTIVVEGDLRSGSLITARLAAEQGRDVGAVPGPIDSSVSEGPLKLLQEGACPIGKIGDVLERLPPGILDGLKCLSLECHKGVLEGGLDGAGKSHYKEKLGEGREKILNLLGSGEVAFEDLVQSAAMDVPALSRLLAELEIDGVIEALPGQFYARR